MPPYFCISPPPKLKSWAGDNLFTNDPFEKSLRFSSCKNLLLSKESIDVLYDQPVTESSFGQEKTDDHTFSSVCTSRRLKKRNLWLSVSQVLFWMHYLLSGQTQKCLVGILDAKSTIYLLICGQPMFADGDRAYRCRISHTTTKRFTQKLFETREMIFLPSSVICFANLLL